MGVNLDKVRKKVKEKGNRRAGKEKKTRYKLIKYEGKVTDVQLLFGAYNGSRISEMVHDPRSINYIKFLLNEENDFPPKFTKYVKRVFDANYDNFLDDDIPF